MGYGISGCETDIGLDKIGGQWLRVRPIIHDRFSAAGRACRTVGMCGCVHVGPINGLPRMMTQPVSFAMQVGFDGMPLSCICILLVQGPACDLLGALQ